MTRCRLSKGATDRPRSTVAGRVARATLLIPVAAWSLVGCYAYLPATSVPGGEAAFAGRTVRVTLTADGTRRVESVLGAGVVEVEGVLERATADSLQLAVRRVATATREQFASTGASVTLPRTVVARTGVQTVSRTRTALVAAGVAALVASLASLVSASSGGSGSGDTGPSPQPQRLPPR